MKSAIQELIEKIQMYIDDYTTVTNAEDQKVRAVKSAFARMVQKDNAKRQKQKEEEKPNVKEWKQRD